jgi:hypothetical protein
LANGLGEIRKFAHRSPPAKEGHSKVPSGGDRLAKLGCAEELVDRVFAFPGREHDELSKL